MTMTFNRAHVKSVDKVLILSFWAYLLLVIFDASLRKWFLPFLSNPILLLRDGLAIVTVMYAIWKQRFPSNGYVVLVVMVMLLSCLATVTVGHGNFPVMLYGARIYLFHFPLIFIYANVMSRLDLDKVNSFFLYISILSTFIIVSQFYSPQSAWINRGIGGDVEGSGFNGGAMGFNRPAGLFSFTTGNIQFYGLAFACVVAAWLDDAKTSRFVLVAATIACIIAIPISIARSYLVQVVLTCLFGVLAVAGRPKYIGRILIAAVGIVLILAVLNLIPFFQEATSILTMRFSIASGVEGGIENTIVTRVFADKANAFTDYWDLGFFGAGLGYSTNFGAKLITGEIQFLSAEDEWGRTTSEIGTVLGALIIFMRIWLGISMTYKSWLSLRKLSPYSWILMSVVFNTLLSGQLGNPTGLGFTIVMCVMVIVGLKPIADDDVIVPQHNTAGRSLNRFAPAV